MLHQENIDSILPEKVPGVDFNVPGVKYFLLFPLPSRNYPAFMNQLWTQKVCLENAFITDDNVTGTIKVINLAFQKKVQVKITYDSWKNHSYVSAHYHATDTWQIDSFTFQFFIPQRTRNVKFCIKYETNSQEFWDNNDGVDYCISASSR